VWIEALFQRHAAKLTTVNRKEGVRERYRGYTDWCGAVGLTVVERRVVLKGEFQAFLTLGGIVHRVDATANGVRGVILGEYRSAWRLELRMPLIQLALAGRYGIDRQDVSVGVQRLDGTGLSEATFDARRIANARREFREMSEYVRQRYGIQP